jgi:uncharacterized membrane protein
VHAPVSAVLLVVAFTFLVKGLERGEASVVVPIAQMGFVVTAMIGAALAGVAYRWLGGEKQN